MIPKFALVNGVDTGKTAGKEVMILQLEQIALNYSKTPEGEKAREMLKYLKSEITLQKTDENGIKMPENTMCAFELMCMCKLSVYKFLIR